MPFPNTELHALAARTSRSTGSSTRFGLSQRLDDALRLPLVEYAVRDLEREIDDLQRQLGVARALGLAPDQAAVRCLDAVLQRAQALRSEAIGEGVS